MKTTIVKSLIIVFGLAWLTGCASSSAGLHKGNDNEKSADKAIAAIEKLSSEIMLKANVTVKSIEYDSVSSADTDKFKQLLKTKGFSLDGARYGIKIAYHNASYIAIAEINLAKARETYKVALEIINNNGDVDARIFDDVFGRINGRFVAVQITKSYYTDLSPYLPLYEGILKNYYGFQQDEIYERYLMVIKNDGNFFYLWGGSASPDESFIKLSIEALPQ